MTTVESAAARKARGAYFTPAPVAEFIAEWAIRTPDDTVLEPSCGEASFLLAAHERLRRLGQTASAPGQLVGVELDRPSADTAGRALSSAGAEATIHVGDFFSMAGQRKYTAVIGNPPYVRYQSFSGTARRAAQEAALAQGVRLTGLSSSWAAFTVQAAHQLTDQGRLGLVLPAELLSVNYAAEVRRFLLERFQRVRLVLFDKLVFADAQADVVLLLAEGRGKTDRFEVYQARDAADLANVQAASWAQTSFGQGKWTSALLDAGAAANYRDVAEHPGFATLSEWGRSYLGAVTGANTWFTLTAGEAETLGLPAAELLPISPPGSRHLRGLAFTQADWQRLRDEGRRAYLFRPQDQPSAAALARIRDGEAQGIDGAYKCRVRKPWWRVPLVAPADLLLTYMNHDTPRLAANRARVRHLNSVHGVALRPGLRRLGMDVLPLAALNSATLLGAEVVGRAYGGGMLKLEPREADALPLPSPATAAAVAPQLRALRPALARDLAAGELLAAAGRVDRVLLDSHLGFGAVQIDALREARALLFNRRAGRGKAAHGKD